MVHFSTYAGANTLCLGVYCTPGRIILHKYYHIWALGQHTKVVIIACQVCRYNTCAETKLVCGDLWALLPPCWGQPQASHLQATWEWEHAPVDAITVCWSRHEVRVRPEASFWKWVCTTRSVVTTVHMTTHPVACFWYSSTFDRQFLISCCTAGYKGGNVQ